MLKLTFTLMYDFLLYYRYKMNVACHIRLAANPGRPSCRSPSHLNSTFVSTVSGACLPVLSLPPKTLPLNIRRGLYI